MAVIHSIFPEQCVVCDTEGASLCENCLHTLPLASTTQFKYIHPLWDYKDKRVKRVVRALKFYHTQSIAHKIAPYLQNLYTEASQESIKLSKEKTYLLPVPPLKRHIQIRGYDHVQHVVQTLSHMYPDQFELLPPTTFTRVNKQAQVGLSREKRLLNMRNAFLLQNPKTLLGRDICIFDDVTTTGATIEELRRLALQHGAKNVFAITIAH